jgi:formylglycine-generating enzyme required for sulfatase activity
MAGKIFINYRRGDEAGFTQALYQRLEDEFASSDLFMDVEGHIKPGDDFVEVLSAQVVASDVFLAVIGPRWTELLAARRDDPDDFVTIEIEAALDQRKRVIPVLVGGASMPRADSLPEAIRLLARRNAMGLRPERFKADCQGLVAELKESLAAAEQERAARTEEERKAAEAARLEVEAQAAARAKVIEERGRMQAAAGLSPEEVRKAEELANWKFIEDRNDIQDLRDHLARFPGGMTERYALTLLDKLVWSGLGPTPKIEQLRAYLDEFPKSANAGPAQARIALLVKEAAEAWAAERLRAQETEAWGAIAASTDKARIEAFLKDWPKGQHAAAAKARIVELRRGVGGLRRGALLGAGVTLGVIAVIGGVLARIYERELRSFAYRATTFDGYRLAAADSARLKPRDAFQECAKTFSDDRQDGKQISKYCPDMVVIPAGSYWMGDGSARIITIKTPFAVSRFTITFDQWDACVAGGGCENNTGPSDQTWGRGSRPVINVDWQDAQSYVEWLNRMAGTDSYRLLSEAEWEYAARGVTSAQAPHPDYPWGRDIGRGNANCNGCGSRWDNKQTAPVGSFKDNAFGLYDMYGNVWQWVEDCYADKLYGAPTDGAVWKEACKDETSYRVVRGGSWDGKPVILRSSFRGLFRPDHRDNDLGFRVARVLSPAGVPSAPQN